MSGNFEESSRRLFLATLASGAGVALAGCSGGGDGENPTATDTQGTPTDDSSTPTPGNGGNGNGNGDGNGNGEGSTPTDQSPTPTDSGPDSLSVSVGRLEDGQSVTDDEFSVDASPYPQVDSLEAALVKEGLPDDRALEHVIYDSGEEGLPEQGDMPLVLDLPWLEPLYEQARLLKTIADENSPDNVDIDPLTIWRGQDTDFSQGVDTEYSLEVLAESLENSDYEDGEETLTLNLQHPIDLLEPDQLLQENNQRALRAFSQVAGSYNDNPARGDNVTQAFRNYHLAKQLGGPWMKDLISAEMEWPFPDNPAEGKEMPIGGEVEYFVKFKDYGDRFPGDETIKWFSIPGIESDVVNSYFDDLVEGGNWIRENVYELNGMEFPIYSKENGNHRIFYHEGDNLIGSCETEGNPEVAIDTVEDEIPDAVSVRSDYFQHKNFTDKIFLALASSTDFPFRLGGLPGGFLGYEFRPEEFEVYEERYGEFEGEGHPVNRSNWAHLPEVLYEDLTWENLD